MDQRSKEEAEREERRLQDERRDKEKQRTIDVVRKMSLDEISYTLGRYCGRSNTFLCEKKFGFVLIPELVEQELKDRTVEDALFGDTE